MGSKNNNQLSEKIIIQAFEFDATSAGIAQPTELVSFFSCWTLIEELSNYEHR